MLTRGGRQRLGTAAEHVVEAMAAAPRLQARVNHPPLVHLARAGDNAAVASLEREGALGNGSLSRGESLVDSVVRRRAEAI